MPLSNYYNTPKFRAVDDDATAINQPLASALEAQIASSHEWLHRNAGGAAAQIKNPGSLSSTSFNATFHVAATWASLLYQPFLVMRGLRWIRVTMLGTVEAYNINTRLELLGFKSSEAVWVIGGTASTNVVRQITLTLDEPAEVEYETDLILWGKSQLTNAITYSVEVASMENGKVQIDPAALSTDANASLGAFSPRWNGTGLPIQTIYESLFRNPTAQTYNGSGVTGAAILGERVSGTTFMAECELGRITTRSFFVEAFYE